MTVMVEKSGTALRDLGGVHPDIEDLPASVLDGLGDHEGDLDAAGVVAQQVYDNWPDDGWRNAFLMGLAQHIENQIVHHKAELQALHNSALAVVQRDGRRAIVKAYLHDVLNETVAKATEHIDPYTRADGTRVSGYTREQQASLAGSMLFAQGSRHGADQTWEYTIRRGNGKVDHQEMGGGQLPKLGKNDRVIRTRQTGGPQLPLTGGDDTRHLVSMLGANSQQAGLAGALAEEMSRQGKIKYGPNSWFHRLESASEMMHTAVSDNNLPVPRRVRMAISAGKYVGKHGPEVSRVLGPHMRRYTYKYRGTQADPTQWTQTARLGRGTGSKGEQEPIDAYRERLTMNLAKSRRDGGLDAIPTAEETRLMLKSGNTPPSHGYILDAQGKVRSQAHGYADDHYVPFNLRDLHALNGGSYVRSRAFGGPTTEDIALAMKTGATGFNIISRNGIYRVDFTPRTNKAGRKVGAWAKDTAGDANQVMVDKYGRLLDRIKNGAVIDPDTQAPVKLNGRGYNLALKTLQKQFPYFIKNVNFTPANEIKDLEGLRASETDTDPGYVRPYYLKPSEAVQGYYDSALGGHHSFDEFDSHRLGRARVWAAEQKRREAVANAQREQERSEQYRSPVRRPGEAPTNMPYRDRNVWAATGGGQGVGTRPKAEAERNMNILSTEDMSAYMNWIGAVLDHADVGSHPAAANLRELVRGAKHEEADPNSPEGKKYQEFTDWYDHVKRDPDERAEVERLLDEVAPQSGTGLEALQARPILRSQGETEESVRGVVGPETHAADFEQDDEHSEYLEFKRYAQLRKNLDAMQRHDQNAKLRPENQQIIDKWEAPDPDYNGMSLAKVWDTPDTDYDGLPYWKHYENAYEEAKHLDKGGSIDTFKVPHPIPEDAEPTVKGPQATEADMNDTTRRHEETSPEREKEAEKEADDFIRRHFGDEPPF